MREKISVDRFGILALLLMSFAICPLYAQSNEGAIAGVVVDQTGAAIRGRKGDRKK